MPTKETFMKALQDVRKADKESGNERKFEQSVDLIINLRDFDVKKTSINLFVTLPHQMKDKKVAAFLEKKSNFVDTVTKEEFDDFKDKKKMKSLVKEYDFFMASAKLMPLVATTFGRILGPTGKMPSPQLGVLFKEDEAAIKELKAKINSVIKVRAKEPSIKVSIGKEKEKDEILAENALAIYNEVYKNLPKQKENLKNVLIKFTMSKPAKVVL